MSKLSTVGLWTAAYGASEIDRLCNEVKEVEQKAKNILNEIIKPGMSDFEKELAIHDYIVENTTYDYDNYIRRTIPRESYSPY
jgi:transglutaminase/protease-like cytokinesis protein 3